MTWDVLIRTIEPHFEYWSAEEGRSGYTGLVRFGRIGRGGSRSHDYITDIAVRDKIRLKLNEGYSRLGHFASPVVSPSQVPSTDEEVEAEEGAFATAELDPTGASERARASQEHSRENQRRIIRESEAEENRINEASAVQRARRRVEQARPSPQPDSPLPAEENFPIKTNRQGQLTTYRHGYKGVEFSKLLEKIKIIHLKDLLTTPSLGLQQAKSYYDRIPTNMVFDKPATIDELRATNRPTFFVIFDISKRPREAMGIVNVNRNQTGLCDFFVVKTTAETRKSLIGFIVKSIANSARTPTITFKLKHAPTLKSIKQLAPFYTSFTRNTLVYDRSALSSGIPAPQAKPPRWLE
jgi:hypothetical protein